MITASAGNNVNIMGRDKKEGVKVRVMNSLTCSKSRGDHRLCPATVTTISPQPSVLENTQVLALLVFEFS